MSQDLFVVKQAGLLQVGNNVFLNSSGTITNGTNSLSVGSSGITLAHSDITQITNSTTPVSVTRSSGVITTVSSTLAGLASSAFTVSNSSVVSGSVVLASIVNYSGVYGTDGVPVLSVSSVVDGGFDVVITNAHATAPLAGVLKISYLIV